jgi:oxidase EvaA
MNKNLEIFRDKVLISAKKEKKNIQDVLFWLRKRNKENKMKVQKISVNQLKDWNIDKNGNLRHKSGQFFSVEGVKVSGAVEREVSNWQQPILNQKHGGILAILTRENNGVIEFLLFARKEPGDSNIKLCPSFSATQSNINRAHGGKKTPLSEFILSKNKNLICETLHFEEGARFWKKPNKNLLISIDYKKSLKIKNPDFIWLNLSQIKKLNLKKGILNPFVKTILFII